MKVLLDECVGTGPLAELERAGHDVAIVAPLPPLPALTDVQVLERAHREGRILVTLDKDFGELSVLRGLPHAGIVRSWATVLVNRAAFVCAPLGNTGRNSPLGRW